ncbi:MAG: ATP-dependent RecD-like DNA helicase [Clostridiales bacterium]|nr:ATP-dependent RecD-like DNA helicase [Clostridiales bacterium]
MTENIQVQWTYTVYKNNDTGYMVCKGKLIPSHETVTFCGQELPEVGDTVIDLSGAWENHSRYGRQFKTTYAILQMPASEQGIVQFLVSLKCGVGKKWAQKLVDKFGTATFDIIEKYPERLLKIKFFGKKRLERLCEALASHKVEESLMRLFGGALDMDKIHKVVKSLGATAPDLIQKNPYNLYKVYGMGFETVEKLAEKLGGDKHDSLRISGTLNYVLQRKIFEGHTCYPEEQLIKTASLLLNRKQEGVLEEEISNVIYSDISNAVLIRYKDFIYLPYQYNSEEMIARKVKEMIKVDSEVKNIDGYIKRFSQVNKFELDEKQEEAVKAVFGNNITVITGGPGTGKSTIIKAITDINQMVCDDNGKNANPILLAPTGRAARRMSETSGLNASTIHSALAIVQSDVNGDVAAHVEENLNNDLVIVDEVSMVDNQIMGILMENLDLDTRLVIVGDPDQLPSVGAGNVLRDFIESDAVPVVKLTTVFRQQKESVIITNCCAVNTGEIKSIKTDGDFKFIATSNSSGTMDKAVKIYQNCIQKYGIDNVVLLNPTRRPKQDSVLCTTDLNIKIQGLINPERGEREFECNGYKLRKGDRVLQTKNQEYIKNGDIGTIKDIVDKYVDDVFQTIMIIDFDGNVMEYTRDDAKNLELAYAMTVHKAQGSQYKVVIMTTDNEHTFMLRRNLIYTGISRATDKVALIGQPEAFRKGIENHKMDVRYTNLKSMLQK